MRLSVGVSRRARLDRWLLLVLGAFVVTAIWCVVASEIASARPEPSGWTNPTVDERPMARSWWPDAGTGASAAGPALITKEVNSEISGGFGGMEINYLADRLTTIPASSALPASQQLGQPGVDQSVVQTTAGACCLGYSNAQAMTVGWGSQNWQNVLTRIFQTADSVPGGFHVDLTITDQWPSAYDTIDPNDLAQMQEATTAYSLISTADTAPGLKQVPLPALRLQDQDGVPFIFVNHYTAATIMKVASVSSNGIPTFSYSSMTDESPQTTEIPGAGYAAGIMDSSWTKNNPSMFTGAITADSTTISNLSSITGATGQAGSLLRGPGIPPGTDIVSVGANSLVMSNPATSSTAAASINATWNINTINADWGPDPSGDPDGATFNGKIDAAGDRKRMADWQYEYQTVIDPATLTNLGCTVPAPGAALAAGDCVLFGTYYQGTGQTRSGGVNTAQYNREYVTGIYNRESTEAIENFWDKKILGTWSGGVVTKPLGDTALIDLIRANANAHPEDAMFEDSYEFSKVGSGSYWAPDVLGEMSSRLGYDAAQYAPLLAGGSTFDSSTAAGELPPTRVTEDFTATLGQDFTNNHINAIQEWAKQTLGYNFKQQSYGAPGVQYAQLPLGVQEVSADSGAAEDGRNLAGAANLTNTNLVSAEALTRTGDYTTPWLTDVQGLNLDWASGINRVNFHGNPLSETFDQLPSETTINGISSEWPGWEFQHRNANGYGAFNARQIYWGDMFELSNYVARTQSVLQGGVAKLDLAVLEGTNASYSSPSASSNSLQRLLNGGWTYNVIDDRMLTLPNAVVTGGVSSGGVPTGAVLDAHGPTNGLHDGPAYKALVVVGTTQLMPVTVQRLIGYAKAGLPIFFYNSHVMRVYGSNQPGGNSTSLTGNNDTALAVSLAKLKATPNVYTVSPATQTALISRLNAVGIARDASYASSGLETVHREIAGRDYYYLYNSNTTGSDLATAVTLSGAGQPYTLDAWTGKVTPIADYTNQPGKVAVNVSLAPQAATIIETGVLGGVGLYATSANGGTIFYGSRAGELVLRTTRPGDYTVSLSNGQTWLVHSSSVASAVHLSQAWRLKLDSWGPDPTAGATDPEVSAVATTTFPANALGSWTRLPATTSQLATLGAAGMSQVSGIGYYTNTFQLSSDWQKGVAGAYLQFAHGSDMVVAVTVNGHEINDINQITNTVDIGPYLQPGTNGVQVKLDTLLGNRVGRATQSYGLTGVTFQPYTDTSNKRSDVRVVYRAQADVDGQGRSGLLTLERISPSRGRLEVTLASGRRLSVNTPTNAVGLPGLVTLGNVDGRSGDELFVDVAHGGTSETINIYTYWRGRLRRAGGFSAYGYDYGILSGITCSARGSKHFITEHTFRLHSLRRYWTRQDIQYLWRGPALRLSAKHPPHRIQGNPSPALVGVRCGRVPVP